MDNCLSCKFEPEWNENKPFVSWRTEIWFHADSCKCAEEYQAPFLPACMTLFSYDLWKKESPEGIYVGIIDIGGANVEITDCPAHQPKEAKELTAGRGARIEEM